MEVEMFFHTTEHPLLFHSTAPVVPAPTELAVVNFDSLVRAADLLRTAQHVVQHDLSTELGPVFDGYGAKLMLMLERVGRNAANNVVCEEQNLSEVEEYVQTR
jgi:hypothetical protein